MTAEEYVAALMGRGYENRTKEGADGCSVFLNEERGRMVVLAGDRVFVTAGHLWLRGNVQDIDAASMILRRGHKMHMRAGVELGLPWVLPGRWAPFGGAEGEA